MSRALLTALAAAAAVALAGAPAAVAYDSGPHAELTQDALDAEGFGEDAVGVVRVNNWFVDLYENGKKNPYSGHGGFWKRLLAGVVTTEHWSEDVMAAADRSHFDSATSTLFNTRGVTAEWDRLRRATWTLVREARDEGDVVQLLTVLGITLHQVQDFYTHTNWVEPLGPFGGAGPDWYARGWGSNPTWFDVPADVREGVTVYTANTEGHYERQHGEWNGYKGDQTLATAMNKDWPGRPLFLESASTAYFATRQWVEAVRSWVGDDAFWARAQAYRAKQSHLDHDLKGAFEVSLFGGHWQGQGEPLGGESGPGGSLISLRQAIKRYFGWHGTGIAGGRSRYRKRFEQLITRTADKTPTGDLAPLPSSQELQRGTKFVVLRILRYKGLGLGDPGPQDEADVYAKVRVDGQAMRSAVYNGNDSTLFRDPNEPFTWLKAVPAVPDRGEPVELVRVDVRTGDRSGAGTDDDVFLRLGRKRFSLDKRAYDDFERDDFDTYSVPIDDAAEAGMTVGDITRVGIETKGDGSWLLRGFKVRVNGRVVADDPAVNRWLEEDRRSFRAPDFVPAAPRGQAVPVWIRIDEDDFGPDDQGDANPYDRRRTISVGYVPGEPYEQTVKGGGKWGGRIDDGDEVRITYRLETMTPEPIPARPEPQPQPTPTPTATPTATPTPVPKPDLVITSFTSGRVTVRNQGLGPAGPFRLRAANAVASQVVTFTGLAAGGSETRDLTLPCEGNYVAEVDDLGQVAETDETNNSKGSEPVIC